MFYGRMLLDTAETTVMIGEHQTIFGNHHSRTESTETDNGICQSWLLRIIQFIYRHLQTEFLHHPFRLFVLAKVPQ